MEWNQLQHWEDISLELDNLIVREPNPVYFLSFYYSILIYSKTIIVFLSFFEILLGDQCPKRNCCIMLLPVIRLTKGKSETVSKPPASIPRLIILFVLKQHVLEDKTIKRDTMESSSSTCYN